jgi:hypothetical protein
MFNAAPCKARFPVARLCLQQDRGEGARTLHAGGAERLLIRGVAMDGIVIERTQLLHALARLITTKFFPACPQLPFARMGQRRGMCQHSGSHGTEFWRIPLRTCPWAQSGFVASLTWWPWAVPSLRYPIFEAVRTTCPRICILPGAGRRCGMERSCRCKAGRVSVGQSPARRATCGPSSTR